MDSGLTELAPTHSGLSQNHLVQDAEWISEGLLSAKYMLIPQFYRSGKEQHSGRENFNVTF